MIDSNYRECIEEALEACKHTFWALNELSVKTGVSFLTLDIEVSKAKDLLQAWFNALEESNKTKED